MREQKDGSFEELYAEYYPYVLRYIGKRINNQSIAEDLAQDIFLSVYKGFSRFDEHKAKFSTWLFVIVNNRLKNYFRDYRQQASLNELEGIPALSVLPEMEQAVFIDECRDAIAAALEQIPLKARQVIILRYFQNKSGVEIAGMLGLSEVNVRVTTYRALEKLQQVIDQRFRGE